MLVVSISFKVPETQRRLFLLKWLEGTTERTNPLTTYGGIPALWDEGSREFLELNTQSRKSEEEEKKNAGINLPSFGFGESRTQQRTVPAGAAHTHTRPLMLFCLSSRREKSMLRQPSSEETSHNKRLPSRRPPALAALRV